MAVDNRMVLLANQSTDNASTNATALYSSADADAMLCGELAVNTNTGVLFVGADPAGTGDGSSATAVGAKVFAATDILATTLSTAATTQAVGTGASPTFAGVTTDALTAGANLDIGAYTITGTQFISDIADGTAPLVVTSTTMIDNLNADMLDGIEATGFVAVGGDDMTGPLVLDDTSLKFEEGSDTLTITVPTLTASRAWTFPDAAGEVATTATAHAYVEANALTLTAALTMSGAHIIVPTGYDVQIADAPGSSTDAANKAYVDAAEARAAQGLSVKTNVVAATTAKITLAAAPPSTTTLTVADGEMGYVDSSNTFTQDGVSVASGGRILVKDDMDVNSVDSAKFNGIYTISNPATSGSMTLTRATDMDADGEFANAFVFVTGGTTNADTGWACTVDEATITVGTTAVTFAQFNSAGTVTAGTNMSKSGNTLNVDDAFLKNDASDTTTGTITAAGFTTTGTWTMDTSAGGTTGITAVNITDSFSDSDTVLMSAGAIKEKIEDYSYGSGDGDMSDLIDDQTPQLYAGSTLDTNSGYISFDDNHGIYDENTNELLWFQRVATAVNYAEITNAATGSGVTVGATGSDSAVDLLLTAKGTGVVKVDGNSLALGGNLTTLGAWTQTGAHTIGITTTGNTAITLPTSGTIVTTSAIQTLTNKTLAGGTF